MKWPWRHREDGYVPQERTSADEAAEALRQLEERQPHVDRIERWARRESRLNGFSERMRQAMGGDR